MKLNVMKTTRKFYKPSAINLYVVNKIRPNKNFRDQFNNSPQNHSININPTWCYMLQSNSHLPVSILPYSKTPTQSRI